MCLSADSPPDADSNGNHDEPGDRVRFLCRPRIAVAPQERSVENRQLALAGLIFIRPSQLESSIHINMSELLLVTTDDCHFCEFGRSTMAALGVTTREISVGSEEAQRLATRGIALAFLPVLTDGSRVIAYGRFSEKRLRRELATESTT